MSEIASTLAERLYMLTCLLINSVIIIIIDSLDSTENFHVVYVQLIYAVFNLLLLSLKIARNIRIYFYVAFFFFTSFSVNKDEMATWKVSRIKLWLCNWFRYMARNNSHPAELSASFLYFAWKYGLICYGYNTARRHANSRGRSDISVK
jgi:hypothetical protein